MHWSGEEYVLAFTGALFLAIVVASFSRRFSMSAGSRASFLSGAVVGVASAVVLGDVDDVVYPLFIWGLPVVPLIIIGFLVRDALAWQPAADAATILAGDEADAGVPRRAAFFPPADHPQSADVGGGGEVRRKAADPDSSPQELAEIAFAHPAARTAVAHNPATPANVLEWLATQDDPAVLSAIGARVGASAAH